MEDPICNRSWFSTVGITNLYMSMHFISFKWLIEIYLEHIQICFLLPSPLSPETIFLVDTCRVNASHVYWFSYVGYLASSLHFKFLSISVCTHFIEQFATEIRDFFVVFFFFLQYFLSVQRQGTSRLIYFKNYDVFFFCYCFYSINNFCLLYLRWCNENIFKNYF